MGRQAGLTEEKLHDLSRWRESEAFDGIERLALDYAEQLTRTPVDVPEELVAALRRELGEPGLVELTAAIAWENFRARFNHALGLGAEGFSEGSFCPLPDSRLAIAAARIRGT